MIPYPKRLKFLINYVNSLLCPGFLIFVCYLLLLAVMTTPLVDSNPDQSKHMSSSSLSKNLLSVAIDKPLAKSIINEKNGKLQSVPNELQFVLLASICFIGFWLCGYIEELIFGKEQFKCGWFLATFELTFFCIITSIGKIVSEMRKQNNLMSSFNKAKDIKAMFKPKSPFYIHGIIGFAMTFARSLTLFSLVYLNYPTQVIFKSMKLIFVLLGSYVCFGLKYSLMEIVGHCLMVIAAILFSLGDHETETRFTPIGVIIVLSSLIFDSIHANFQAYALNKCNSNIKELMIYSNGIAAILSFFACIITNEIWIVLEYIDNNSNILYLFLLRSFAIYIGAVAYLQLTKSFGAVIASEVTTARKVLTIISSYYLFPKPFVNSHQIGFAAFISAILIAVYAKRIGQQKKCKDDNNKT